MQILREILSSKKALAAISGTLTTALTFVALPPEIASQASALITAIVCAYVLGQGWADTGKHAAAINHLPKPRNRKAPQTSPPV